MHVLTWVFLACSLAFSVFYFGGPILQRVWSSICDLGLSLGAYGVAVFTARYDVIQPTVQLIPENMDAILPLTVEELEIFLALFWDNFKNEKNILAYLWQVFENIALFFSTVALAIVPLLLIFLLIRLLNGKIDNDYAKNSRGVEIFEKFRRGVWWKIKGAVEKYMRFVKEKNLYFWAFLVIWSYNLNFITIALELVAWVFYISWVGTIDGIIASLLVILAKTAIDFSVAALFIPGLVWCIIIYWIFCKIRRGMGLKALERMIERGYEIIKKYPGAIFVNGKQRAKKTSLIVFLKMLYERLFRRKSFEKMEKRDCMFPLFPWITLERFIDKARAEHKIYLAYHCKKLIRKLRAISKLPKERQEHYLKRLKKIYGYDFEDCYFGYDISNGFEYDDGIVKIDLFYALEMYAQLYFVYHKKRPYDLSNLSIREDFEWVSHGNFPIFDGDLLRKTSKESQGASQYSTVIDFDAFRPGMKFDPNNPFRDAVEFGIGVVQEVDKERKNSKTRSAGGNKGNGELGIATQDNDGFEVDLKVRGQVSLIDFTDFWVWLIDAQRVGDLGASNAELTNQFYIKGPAEEHLLLPFFEIEYALYSFLSGIYSKIHYWFRARQGSNTLLHHLLKLAFEPIFKAFDRIEKEFTAWKLNIKVTDGGDGELLGMEQMWILEKVVYRDRFASDVCKAFYEYRFERSKFGMDDMESYTATETDVKKMMKQNSYFTEDMTVYNGQESRRKRAEQRKKAKK